MYRNGLGVGKNYQEALRWYRMAAEKRNADAEYSLGLMYANGEGTPRDSAGAVRWLRLSRSHGDSRAGEALSAISERR